VSEKDTNAMLQKSLQLEKQVILAHVSFFLRYTVGEGGG
jgi:hypothetical protein